MKDAHEVAEQPLEIDASPSSAWADIKKAVNWGSDDDTQQLIDDLLQEAQEALTYEQSELVLLLRSHDNLAVVTFSSLGLITSVCKNSSDLLGRSVDHLIGQPIDALLVKRAHGVEVTGKEMSIADDGEVVHAVHNHLREDGTKFEAEHTLVAVVGRGDRIMGFVREIREVTDQKMHESHIQELDRVIGFLLKAQAKQQATAASTP